MWTNLRLTWKVLCVVLERGKVFPHYQWVIYTYQDEDLIGEGPHTHIAFHYKGAFYNCTKKDMLQDHLLMNYRLENIDERGQLISGYTYTDIKQ